MRRSAPKDIARWILFASAITIASTLICAIVTNEVSERALRESGSVLDLFDFDQTLEKYICKHGNTALRAIIQDWTLNTDASSTRAIFRFVKSNPGKFDGLQQEKKARDIAQSYIEDIRTAWNYRLNEIHISPGPNDGLSCVSVALPLVASWLLMAKLLRTRRFRPFIERILPAHDAFSARSYTLLTSTLRPRSDLSFSWHTVPSISLMIPIVVTSAGAVFLANSEGSPSDLMEATAIGRFVSFSLSAAVWGRTYAAVAKRFPRLNPPMIRGITGAGAGGMWSALAIYALASVIGEQGDTGPKTPNLILAIVITPLLAIAHSPGGALFAIAYSIGMAGPKAFDAARSVAFSSERYPLLNQMRSLHGATAEKRSFEAREYAFAQVRIIIDRPLYSAEAFWGFVTMMAWLTVLSRRPIYRQGELD